MEQVLTAVPYPHLGEYTWGPICPVHPAWMGNNEPTDYCRSNAEAFAEAVACGHPDHKKAYVLRYETNEQGFEETVTHFIDNFRAIELLGHGVARRADIGLVWNIAVLNIRGEDVTFDFKCFQN